MTAPQPHAPLLHSPLLHSGRVTHVRHTPFSHRFGYRMWMLSVDLDAIPDAGLVRHNRRGVVSLHDADHGPRDGTPLRPWAEAQLRQAGLDAFSAQIRFMVIPRVLGFAFNPIAFFFCRDASGRLGAVIHQVKNTFGNQTAYVLPVDEARPIRQAAAKAMHVSPFFDMQGGYRFAFSEPDFGSPGNVFGLTLQYGADVTPRMTAALRLVQRACTTVALLRLLLAMPLMPLGVFAAIHWQALLLWLRGAKYHPVAPSPSDLGVRA